MPLPSVSAQALSLGVISNADMADRLDAADGALRFLCCPYGKGFSLQADRVRRRWAHTPRLAFLLDASCIAESYG